MLDHKGKSKWPKAIYDCCFGRLTRVFEPATDRSIVDERIGLDHKGEGRASSVRLYKVI